MKVLVLLVCFLLACSAESGEEFQVEEVEVRNLKRHAKVVMVQRQDEEDDFKEDVSTEVVSGPSGAPPSYEVAPADPSDEENKAAQLAGGNGASKLDVTALLLTSFAFLMVFV
ncbi:hypothetical protein ACHWQZ_G016798 [Mnemiopsis leidyi]